MNLRLSVTIYHLHAIAGDQSSIRSSLFFGSLFGGDKEADAAVLAGDDKDSHRSIFFI